MLTGFSVGGDDYISKPFSIKEVIARIKAVVKRLEVKKNTKELTTELTFAGIVINMDKKELTVDGEKVALTKTEFEILALLATNVDKVFSREDIIQTVWRETPYITERTVDVHIARLRKKMGEYSSLIANRSGYGYRFNIGE